MFRNRSFLGISLCSLSGAPQFTMPVRSDESSERARHGETANEWEPSVSLVGRPGTDLLLIDFAIPLEKYMHVALNNAAATERRKEKTLPMTTTHSNGDDTKSPDSPQSVAEREKLLGNKKISIEDFNGAIEHYNLAIAASPRTPTLYSNRALAYLKLGEFEKSEKDCKVCLKLDPKNVKALLRRAYIRAIQGRLPEALEDYQNVLRLEPNNKQATYEIERMRKLAVATMGEGAQ